LEKFLTREGTDLEVTINRFKMLEAILVGSSSESGQERKESYITKFLESGSSSCKQIAIEL
jgi:hypothetical protein